MARDELDRYYTPTDRAIAQDWWTAVQRARARGDLDHGIGVLRALASAYEPGSDEAMRLRRAVSAIEDMERLHGLGCPMPATHGRGARVRLDPWHGIDAQDDAGGVKP